MRKMTPLRLYETLRARDADFGFDDGRFYVAADNATLERYKPDIDKHAGALAAIAREFSEPAVESAVTVIDRAERIIRGHV